MSEIAKYLNYNGEIILADSPFLAADNRAFLYGDGLFETLRVIDGELLFFHQHYTRLTEGMKTLKMSIPDHFTPEYLKAQCDKALSENDLSEGARVRVTVYRDAGGFYLPDSNKIGFTIVCKPLEQNAYQLNEFGLSLDVYDELKKPINKLSNFKTLNTQLFVLASLDAKAKGLSDALILNDKHNVIETASSNIFLVSNGVLYTPSLEEGCLGGVMRMQVINLALENKLKVYECSLTPTRLLSADEIFITNTAKGIQWVGTYRAKRYYHKLSGFLLERLNHKVLINSKKDLQGSLRE